MRKYYIKDNEVIVFDLDTFLFDCFLYLPPNKKRIRFKDSLLLNDKRFHKFLHQNFKPNDEEDIRNSGFEELILNKTYLYGRNYKDSI